MSLVSFGRLGAKSVLRRQALTTVSQARFKSQNHGPTLPTFSMKDKVCLSRVVYGSLTNFLGLLGDRCRQRSGVGVLPSLPTIVSGLHRELEPEVRQRFDSGCTSLAILDLKQSEAVAAAEELASSSS